MDVVLRLPYVISLYVLMGQDRKPLVDLPESYDLSEQAAIFLSCLENASKTTERGEDQQSLLQAVLRASMCVCACVADLEIV